MKAAPIAMAVPAATALDRRKCDAKRCSILLLLFCDTLIFRHQKATEGRLPSAERPARDRCSHANTMRWTEADSVRRTLSTSRSGTRAGNLRQRSEQSLAGSVE